MLRIFIIKESSHSHQPYHAEDLISIAKGMSKLIEALNERYLWDGPFVQQTNRLEQILSKKHIEHLRLEALLIIQCCNKEMIKPFKEQVQRLESSLKTIRSYAYEKDAYHKLMEFQNHIKEIHKKILLIETLAVSIDMDVEENPFEAMYASFETLLDAVEPWVFDLEEKSSQYAQEVDEKIQEIVWNHDHMKKNYPIKNQLRDVLEKMDQDFREFLKGAEEYSWALYNTSKKNDQSEYVRYDDAIERAYCAFITYRNQYIKALGQEDNNKDYAFHSAGYGICPTKNLSNPWLIDSREYITILDRIFRFFRRLRYITTSREAYIHHQEISSEANFLKEKVLPDACLALGTYAAVCNMKCNAGHC
jgi:hypothetical protein